MLRRAATVGRSREDPNVDQTTPRSRSRGLGSFLFLVYDFSLYYAPPFFSLLFVYNELTVSAYSPHCPFSSALVPDITVTRKRKFSSLRSRNFRLY